MQVAIACERMEKASSSVTSRSLSCSVSGIPNAFQSFLDLTVFEATHLYFVIMALIGVLTV